MARGGRKADKERFWRRAVADWRTSGLGIRDFCQRRGLAQPSFYFWRRLLNQSNSRGRRLGTRTLPQRPGTTLTQKPGTTLTQKPGTTLTQQPGTTLTQQPGLFVPVRVVDKLDPSGGLSNRPGIHGATGALEVVGRNGRVVRVAAGFEPAVLLQVLALLEDLPC